MRKAQDPVIREHMLHMYRNGYSHGDVARTTGISTTYLKGERTIDPEWDRAVQEAMASAFTPVMAHAIELAQQADAEGENVGSIKALDLVMKFYTKQLDREVASEMADKKIAAQLIDSKGGQGPSMPVGPGGMEALIAWAEEEDDGDDDIEDAELDES